MAPPPARSQAMPANSTSADATAPAVEHRQQQSSKNKLLGKVKLRIPFRSGRPSSSRTDRAHQEAMLASPVEGHGTKPLDDKTPLGATPKLHLAPDSSSSESDSDSSCSDSESDDDDTEGPSTVAETSTDDEDVEAPALAALVQSVSQATLTVPPAVTRTDSSASVTRKGLKLPAFMKRTGSSRSVMTSESDAIGSSAASEPAGDGMDTSRRKKKFGKKSKKHNKAEGELGDTDAAGGEKPRKRKVKRTKEEKKIRKEEKLQRRRTKRDYRYNDGDADLFGLVQIECKGATELPRFKNMLKTGFDMDAFLVVSFGKKVFRTRVIRHSLNPVWDEKLFFPVRRTETNWTVAFHVYDWDKMSSNDHVGDISLPLSELLGTTIKPDENGLFACTSEGRLIGDDFKDHQLPIDVTDKERDPGGSSPKLLIRAKFTPYDALRQQFMRTYLRQYDIDESNAYSYLEIFSALDSLGSTLSKETIGSFFTRFGKSEDQELTADEVVLCLEAELHKKTADKRRVDPAESGDATPSLASTEAAVGNTTPMTFGGGAQTEEPMEELTDPSANMQPIAAGTQVVTNSEQGTVVTPSASGLAVPEHQRSFPGRQHSLPERQHSSSEDSTADLRERIINVHECPLCHKPRMHSKAELDIITHMGICSSTDPHAVNRIVVGEYVTASQAQRKWFTKIISKATKGAYSLGADSANIIVQDRLTGTLLEEKMAVYVRLGIRMMYRGIGIGGGMEGARVRRMLESMSVKQGAKYDSPSSVDEIAPFIEFHNLDMNETLDPISSYKTFNQFFYRKLKPDARPVADPTDPKTLVSPADCRAMFFPTVNEATKIWIKGRDFSVQRMLGEQFKDKASKYEGGSLAIFRLAPQDYHRYHSPVDGVCGPHSKIAGKYYTVNPMAIRSSIDVYGENVRLVAPIISPEFGEVMNVWVGAMLVASIHMTIKEGDQIARGQECGFFAFGGSTIVVLFEPGTVVFDEDLVQNSANSIETLVRMGMRIGRKA